MEVKDEEVKWERRGKTKDSEERGGWWRSVLWAEVEEGIGWLHEGKSADLGCTERQFKWQGGFEGIMVQTAPLTAILAKASWRTEKKERKETQLVKEKCLLTYKQRRLMWQEMLVTTVATRHFFYCL